MRFHLLPLVLLAVVTLDVITAHPKNFLDTGDTVKVPRKGALAQCRGVVRDVTGGLSRLAGRVRGRGNNKEKKGEEKDATDKKQKGKGFGIRRFVRAHKPGRPSQVAVSTIPPVSPVKKKLVSDNNGDVYICEDDKAEESPYVLKEVTFVSLREDFDQEFKMHEKAHKACPNYVTKPYDYAENGEHTSFKSQFGDGGDLLNLFYEMDEDENITLNHYRLVFYYMAEALECLHANRIAHLDIKPNNYVLRTVKGKGPFHTVVEKVGAIQRGDMRILIIDFGKARDILDDGSVTLQGGTTIFDAPEAIQKKQFPRKYLSLVDVHSLGKSYFFVSDLDFTELVLRNEVADQLPYPDDLKFKGQKYPYELYEIISIMTDENPGGRQELSALLDSSDFFTSLYRETLWPGQEVDLN